MPSYSGTLPVMFINTEGYRNITSKDKDDYLHADWWLEANGVENVKSLGSRQQPLGMLIKGRGNYSWDHLSKKSFRIKFDNKQAILGMKSNRHFCLLANDHCTNATGFEISRRIGLAYTPAQAPVEVVLNGQYIGLYFLTEKIRVSKNRVDIIEQANGEEDESLATGGWLLEIDNRPEQNSFIFQEGNGDWIGVNYHSPDSLSPVQYNYIYDFITNTDKAIYGDGDWEDYIDIDTLACYYIVNEVTDEIESFTNSLYLHKHRGDSTKLLFGPVWDFGCSFGRPELAEPCFIYENTPFAPHWLNQLVTYPSFQAAVREHWNRFYPSQFEDMEQYIDSLVDRIQQASVTDRMRWPENYIWFPDIKSYSEQYFKPKFRDKIKFLHEQWSHNSDSTATNP